MTIHGAICACLLIALVADVGFSQAIERDEQTRKWLKELISNRPAAQKFAYEQLKSRQGYESQLLGIITNRALRPNANRDSEGTNKRAVLYAAWLLGETKSEYAIGPLIDMFDWAAMPTTDRHDVSDVTAQLRSIYPAVRALRDIGEPACKALLEEVSQGRLNGGTELYQVAAVLQGLGQDRACQMIESKARVESGVRRNRLLNPVFVRKFEVDWPKSKVFQSVEEEEALPAQASPVDGSKLQKKSPSLREADGERNNSFWIIAAFASVVLATLILLSMRRNRSRAAQD